MDMYRDFIVNLVTLPNFIKISSAVFLQMVTGFVILVGIVGVEIFIVTIRIRSRDLPCAYLHRYNYIVPFDKVVSFFISCINDIAFQRCLQFLVGAIYDVLTI